MKLILTSLLLSSTAFGYGINDRANLFKEETKKILEQDMIGIQKTVGEDLMIDTYVDAPSIEYGRFAMDTAPEKGIHIVVSTNPRHLEVAIKHYGFYKAEDKDNMASLLMQKFRVNEFDKGILVASAYAAVRANPKEGSAAVAAPVSLAPTQNFWWLKWVFFGFTGLVLLGIFRYINKMDRVAKFKAREYPTPSNDPAPSKSYVDSLGIPAAAVAAAAAVGYVGASAYTPTRRDEPAKPKKKKSSSSDDDYSSSSSSSSSYDSGSSSSSFDGGSFGGDFGGGGGSSGGDF